MLKITRIEVEYEETTPITPSRRRISPTRSPLHASRFEREDSKEVLNFQRLLIILWLLIVLICFILVMIYPVYCWEGSKYNSDVRWVGFFASRFVSLSYVPSNIASTVGKKGTSYFDFVPRDIRGYDDRNFTERMKVASVSLFMGFLLLFIFGVVSMFMTNAAIMVFLSKIAQICYSVCLFFWIVVFPYTTPNVAGRWSVTEDTTVVNCTGPGIWLILFVYLLPIATYASMWCVLCNESDQSAFQKACNNMYLDWGCIRCCCCHEVE
mmetsp:Transcript_3007/g.3371  ORF Transcript_3007/g.3371 Transcript_3007/m.3371 type:complete len:267 (-) Transcript_3007:46-846(-)